MRCENCKKIERCESCGKELFPKQDFGIVGCNCGCHRGEMAIGMPVCCERTNENMTIHFCKENPCPLQDEEIAEMLKNSFEFTFTEYERN